MASEVLDECLCSRAVCCVPGSQRAGSVLFEERRKGIRLFLSLSLFYLSLGLLVRVQQQESVFVFRMMCDVCGLNQPRIQQEEKEKKQLRKEPIFFSVCFVCGLECTVYACSRPPQATKYPVLVRWLQDKWSTRKRTTSPGKSPLVHLKSASLLQRLLSFFTILVALARLAAAFREL